MKRIVIAATIILVCLVTLFIVCANMGKPSMTGLCLVTADEKYLIVDENGSPIVMSNQSNNENLFKALKTGYKIRIKYDGIDQSYPGQTGVYSCKLIKKGSIDDIPKQTLSQLEEMGWTFK